MVSLFNSISNYHLCPATAKRKAVNYISVHTSLCLLKTLHELDLQAQKLLVKAKA